MIGTSAVPAAAAQRPAVGPVQGQRVKENIYLCQDGVYRWVYEYKLMSNPTILITIMKVLGLSVGILKFFIVFRNFSF